jgi:DNA-binding NtrC family response regulator
LRSLGARDYDCIITEVVVAGGCVAELIDAFRAGHPNKPVIICSGFPETDIRLSTVRPDEYTYIAKPFAPREFAAKVVEQIAASTPLSDVVETHDVA